MSLPNEIAGFLRSFPQIYFACHRRHVRDESARKTLSLNQASTLDHLDSVEPTNLRSLARHMGVTASTMSLNVDRLERDGYVRRERNRTDTRQIELRLTVAGDRLKQQQQALDPELVGNLLDRLNARDRADALRGLNLLADAATEIIMERSANNPRAGSPGGKTKKDPL